MCFLYAPFQTPLPSAMTPIIKRFSHCSFQCTFALVVTSIFEYLQTRFTCSSLDFCDLCELWKCPPFSLMFPMISLNKTVPHPAQLRASLFSHLSVHVESLYLCRLSAEAGRGCCHSFLFRLYSCFLSPLFIKVHGRISGDSSGDH